MRREEREMNEEMTYEYEGIQVYRKCSIYDYEGNRDRDNRRMRLRDDIWSDKEWIQYCKEYE